MLLPDWLKTGAEGELILSVRIQPRASRNEVSYDDSEHLRVRVSAPPVDQAANTALIKLLASVWGIRKSSFQISSGLKSRNKTVTLLGITAADLVARFPSVPGN